VAAQSGIVEHAGDDGGGYGNQIDLRHPDGSLTRYAHASQLLVHLGQSVTQGQVIAEVGTTGHSTGPHLHFEVHPPGQGAVNPIAYLPAPAP
jgi:murein DD-endopeptidase MepM/ murein hydrolase activator NlpD